MLYVFLCIFTVLTSPISLTSSEVSNITMSGDYEWLNMKRKTLLGSFNITEVYNNNTIEVQLSSNSTAEAASAVIYLDSPRLTDMLAKKVMPGDFEWKFDLRIEGLPTQIYFFFGSLSLLSRLRNDSEGGVAIGFQFGDDKKCEVSIVTSGTSKTTDTIDLERGKAILQLDYFPFHFTG